MIVRSSMHESYLSNAWLVADRAGGSACIIDTGAPVEPLLDAVAELDLTVTGIINTHEHHDHTLHNIPLQERFDVPVHGPEALPDGRTLVVGDLRLVARSTPGHTAEHVSIVATPPDSEPAAVFTGDVLFAGTVGGTLDGGIDGYERLRHSIMDVLLQLPDDTVVHPGHDGSTTIGAERAGNPFIKFWDGRSEALEEAVTVAGNEATLLLWAPDYDGGHKALVRFAADGRCAIVGGSMVPRAGS